MAFEELGVEGDLSPVASDPQEVVDLRRHVAVAHEVALSDSSSISFFWRSVMGTGTGTCSSSGSGSWMSSLVIMSVNCFTAFISSGRFWKRANPFA